MWKWQNRSKMISTCQIPCIPRYATRPTACSGLMATLVFAVPIACGLPLQEPQPQRPPTTEFLQTPYDILEGKGDSNFVDAIAVAANTINRAIDLRPRYWQ